jgi:hypothetical protein
MEDQEQKKKCKTFKEYYSNPEFKEKHKAYINEKIKCDECGNSVSRVNMAKHKKTNKCKNLKLKNKSKIIDEIDQFILQELIEERKKALLNSKKEN